MTEILLTIILIALVFNIYITFKAQNKKSDNSVSEIKNILSELISNLLRLEEQFRNEFATSRKEANQNARNTREETSSSLKKFEDAILRRMFENVSMQQSQLDKFGNDLSNLIKSNETSLDKVRNVLASSMKSMQNDNSKKLDEIRVTVDEKLQTTLEKRFSESFRLISDRLELVHKGLGEMQNLATGVGDLKKVLSNVKTKGILGELQLGNILEQLLTPDQFARNVKTRKNSNAMVEFAIKLPRRNESNGNVWLPIDAKFPTEVYQRLTNAYEQSDKKQVEISRKELARQIKLCAKDISEKYIDVPATTDFAIMFLPIEGLYAEVLRDIGLFEFLQRNYKVIVTGPTTLSAILNSLQMGFRTLAIEKRSSEVWEVLGAVKTEFAKFGDVLDKTQKKLLEASNVIDQAGIRTRAIERKLRNVEIINDNN